MLCKSVWEAVNVMFSHSLDRLRNSKRWDSLWKVRHPGSHTFWDLSCQKPKHFHWHPQEGDFPEQGSITDLYLPGLGCSSPLWFLHVLLGRQKSRSLKQNVLSNTHITFNTTSHMPIESGKWIMAPRFLMDTLLFCFILKNSHSNCESHSCLLLPVASSVISLKCPGQSGISVLMVPWQPQLVESWTKVLSSVSCWVPSLSLYH